jgi:hypothetical protein
VATDLGVRAVVWIWGAARSGEGVGCVGVKERIGREETRETGHNSVAAGAQI